MVPTFTLLTLAIISLWVRGAECAGILRRNLWLMITAASLVSALLSGVVEPIALVAIAPFAAAAFSFSRPQAGRPQLVISVLAILILAVGLMLHRFPGFNNVRVISGVRFSADTIPFTLYLNDDKTFVGLLLLGWCHLRIARANEWRVMLVTAAPWAAGLIALMMLLSVAMGYVRFDPKFPAETWLWLWVNLIFTCVAEEAFFRGFVQAQLQRLSANVPRGQMLALTVAAVLFGLAHAAGGAMYVALATVAGLGYGWIYQQTRRIEASILTHFALNAVHFFAFSYPALQRAG